MPGPILFDLDGTVIDTGPLIAESFRNAVGSVLGTVIPDEELLRYVGGWGVTPQMQRFVGMLNAGPEKVEELVETHRAYIEPRHEGIGFCAGMHELLLGLRRRGVQTGVVTAKRRSTAEAAFVHLPELAELFDTVVCAEDTERHKPDPSALLLALERLQAAPQSSAYIGDSPFDVEAARAGGLRSIAVTWGGIHDRERLLEAEPDAIASTPEELIEALAVSPT